MAASRQYDLVIHGATGYTGKLIAEHVAESFATNLTWALAGRSASKLDAIVQEFKTRYPDRKSPAVYEVALEKDALAKLAAQTTVLINAVGPYHIYSTPVVEACAENGTHYLDVTGEVPWTGEMVAKYHTVAQKTGAIIIPQCGVESSPPDILSYGTAAHLRMQTDLETADLTYALYKIKGSVSGGTAKTIVSIFDSYGALAVAHATRPSALTPAPLMQPTAPKKSLLTHLFGIRTVPDLGVTTTNPVGATDVPIVNRTWSLLQTAKRVDAYGPDFRWTPALIVRNNLLGVIVHAVALLSGLALALKPVRWLLGRLALAPGSGPSKEEEAGGMFEARAVAVPSQGHPRAVGKIRWEGGPYHWTSILVGEAAASILYGGSRLPAKQLGGGVLTPATLGQEYIERLEECGTRFEFRIVAS